MSKKNRAKAGNKSAGRSGKIIQKDKQKEHETALEKDKMTESEADVTSKEGNIVPEEDKPHTNSIIDSILEDSDKCIILAAAFVLFLGSFLEFWGVNTEAGKISQDSLFQGFLLGGIFGKVCVILEVLSVIAVCINIVKYGWYCSLISAAAFVIQALLVIIRGKASAGGNIYFGFGFFISLAAVVIEVIIIRKIKLKQKH